MIFVLIESSNSQKNRRLGTHTYTQICKYQPKPDNNGIKPINFKNMVLSLSHKHTFKDRCVYEGPDMNYHDPSLRLIINTPFGS